MRPLLLAVTVLLVAAPAAQAARTYRDAEMLVTVRVAEHGRGVTLTTEYACAPVRVKATRRDGRFARTVTVDCADGEQRVRVTGRLSRNRVAGTVDGGRYVAVRGEAPPTAAERCDARGGSVVGSRDLRVYTYGPRTIACVLEEGDQAVLGFAAGDELDAHGVVASLFALEGTRVAFLRDPFDTTADRYAQGDAPSLQPTVAVVDVTSGATLASTSPGMSEVRSIVLHPDGRAAWAGPSMGGTLVMTAVGPLGQGPFDAASLRVAGPGFAWG